MVQEEHGADQLSNDDKIGELFRTHFPTMLTNSNLIKYDENVAADWCNANRLRSVIKGFIVNWYQFHSLTEWIFK